MSYKRFSKLHLIFLFLSAIHASRPAFASARDPFLNQKNGGDPADGLCALAADITRGFTCKEHKVTTDDGYILSVQRIFSAEAAGGVRPLQPVLLQHGVLVDGMTWLMNSAEQSLAMMLATKGYDVWISNVRGTRFSTQHSYLNPFEQQTYWDWTFHELATRDLPSVINFIFKETHQQIHYVGHSMGTTMALVLLCEGNLTNVVKSVVLLSPIAHLSNITSQLVWAGAESFIGDFGEKTGLADKFDPAGLDVGNFVEGLCKPLDCSNMLTALGGQNCCLNKTIIGSFLDNDVQSTSTKNLVHFSQNVRTGAFAKYDYGDPLLNIGHYGAAVPAMYDLSKIPSDLPLFLSYGGQDAMSDVKDVHILFDALNKTHDPEKMQVVFIQKYAHMDFILGTDANRLVYNPILEFFRKHV